MAKFVQKGDIIDFSNSTEESINYGDVVIIGTKIGIAVEEIKPREIGGVRVNGVFEFEAANAPKISIGDTLYYDSTNANLTSTKGDLTIIAGYSISEKAATTDGTVLCKVG